MKIEGPIREFDVEPFDVPANVPGDIVDTITIDATIDVPAPTVRLEPEPAFA